jgi:hypothetical protein
MLNGCGREFTRAEALRRHRRSKAGSKCGRPADGEVSNDDDYGNLDDGSVDEQQELTLDFEDH